MATVDVISAHIGDKPVALDEIHRWETKRLAKAAGHIGLPAPGGELATARLRLAEAKIALGADEIRRRVARRLRVSGLAATATSAASLGRRTVSRCDLTVRGGDARTFAEWFLTADRSRLTVEMLAVNPDHYLILDTDDGRLEVIETVGGSPLPSQLFIDHHDRASLRTPEDPACDAEIAGVARIAGGRAVGGVRHLFYDTADGFRARLQVEFPVFFAPPLVREHRWHLAVEFGNWIGFAFDGAAPSA